MDQYKIKTIHPSDPYKELVVYGTPIISETEPTEKWNGLIWKKSTGTYIYLNSNWEAITSGGTGNGDIIGPEFSTDGNFAVFSGDEGKVLADSGLSPSDFAPTLHTHTDQYQPISLNLTSLSNLAAEANNLPYFSSANTLATTPISIYMRSILGAADAVAIRDAIGVGLGTGNVVGPLISVVGNVAVFDSTDGGRIKDSGIDFTTLEVKNHQHTFALIKDKPTTLEGYGITDAQPKGNELTALQALADTTGFMRKTGDGKYAIDANSYSLSNHLHSVYSSDLFLVNADVYSNIKVVNGIITALETRTMTPQNIGAQPVGNELTALQALTDTAGFLRKTGDGQYEIDINTYAISTHAHAFDQIIGQIVTNQIADDAITTIKIIDFAVTNAKIHSVDASKITTGTLNVDRIEASSITAAKMVTGTITAESGIIANLAITNANIQDAAITNVKIDRASANKLVIVEADIADASITYAKIGEAAVRTANIQLGAITTALIEDGAVGKIQIADGSITNAKIVDLSANKINSGELATERLIIRDPVDPTKSLIFSINNISGALQSVQGETLNGEILTPRTITADKIVANEITANEIAAKTITTNEIATNTIIAANMHTGTITAESGIIGSLDISLVTAGKLSADFIEGGQLDIGGLLNGQGIINVYAEDGTSISRLDNEGITINRGAITGPAMQFDVTTGKFVMGTNDVDALIGFKMKFDGTNLIFGQGSITWGNLDEETQKSITPYSVNIISTNGTMFKGSSTFSTTLKAFIYQGENDVTDETDYSRFRWIRTSTDTIGDTAWNNAHIGYKEITITQDDVIRNSTFDCEITE